MTKIESTTTEHRFKHLFESMLTEDFLIQTPIKQKGTSEKYKDSVKIFLDNIDVRATEKITKTTWNIIYNFLDDFRLPHPGEQIRIRTQQQINLISIILKITDVHNIIENLTIATYTLNKEAFSIIIQLLKSGRIKHLSLFLASSYTFRDKNYYDYLKQSVIDLQRNNYNISLVFAWLHLKITIIKCGKNYYQIEGSMNYSMNNMAEQILFENSKESYDYDLDFLNTIITSNQHHKALEIVGKRSIQT